MILGLTMASLLGQPAQGEHVTGVWQWLGLGWSDGYHSDDRPAMYNTRIDPQSAPIPSPVWQPPVAQPAASLDYPPTVPVINAPLTSLGWQPSPQPRLQRSPQWAAQTATMHYPGNAGSQSPPLQYAPSQTVQYAPSPPVQYAPYVYPQTVRQALSTR
ncbi:MAG: hypothetical protein ACC628_04240 [Pirellulaceae bacterium]